MLLDGFHWFYYQLSVNLELLCFAGFVWFILYFFLIYPFILSPLRNIPGPYTHRLGRFQALRKQRNGSWSETVHNLHLKYGDVVILSPSEISVNGSSRYIHEIYVKNFPKSKFYANFTNHGARDNIFATLDNETHLKYKKNIMGLYSKSAVYSHRNRIRNQIYEKTHLLVEQVHDSSITGNSPDIINAKSEYNDHGKGFIEGSSWFNKSNRVANLGIDVFSLFGSFAMDLISAFELGSENGTNFLQDPKSRSMILLHRTVASMGFWTTLMPKLWNLAAGPKVRAAAEKVEEWQLQLYKQAELNVPDFNVNENKTTLETLKKKGFKGKDAYSFISDNIFAGHETTAIQLTYLTYELSRTCHKHLQQRLQQELRLTFGDPQSFKDIINDFETLDKLPFLNALLEENSRVHSSIPGAEPRIVDKTYFINLNNQKPIQIPIGTTISVLPYSIHRQPDIFPQPDHFIPDRWLQSEYETDQEYKLRILNQQKYMMPFGKGIRMCLGMQIALIEMKMAIANLYWHYSSKIDDDWCDIVDYTVSNDKLPNIIKIGRKNVGNNKTDEEKMVMYDSYTTRPVNDECWLRWFEY